MKNQKSYWKYDQWKYVSEKKKKKEPPEFESTILVTKAGTLTCHTFDILPSRRSVL